MHVDKLIQSCFNLTNSFMFDCEYVIMFEKNFVVAIVLLSRSNRIPMMEDTCFVPLKVIAFSWQLLLNKIPTRVILFQRKVIARNVELNMYCVINLMRRLLIFSVSVSFLNRTWKAISKQLEEDFAIPYIVYLNCFLNLCWSLAGLQIIYTIQGMVLNVVIQAIWEHKKGIIFSSVAVDPDGVRQD